MSSNKSFVILSGVTLLEHPRTIAPDKPKSIVFDAQMRFGGGKNVITGHLLYFNKYDFDFEEAGSLYCHVEAKVVAMSGDREIRPSSRGGRSQKDYDFYGDLVKVVPMLAGEESFVDAYGPSFEVCGTVQDVNDASSSFTITATQWTTGSPNGSLQVLATIPNNNRFADKHKYMPRLNSQSIVWGQLTKVDRGEDGYPSSFHLEFENIVFLGRQTIPLTSSPSTPGSNKSLGKRKAPATPDAEPSPLAEKRRRLLSAASSLSSDAASASGGRDER